MELGSVLCHSKLHSESRSRGRSLFFKAVLILTCYLVQLPMRSRVDACRDISTKEMHRDDDLTAANPGPKSAVEKVYVHTVSNPMSKEDKGAKGQVAALLKPF